MAIDITAAPSGQVANHTAPERSGYKFESSWRVPSQYTGDANNSATAIDNIMDFNCVVGGRSETVRREESIPDSSTTSMTVDLSGFRATNGSRAWFSRSSFYPLTGRMLRSVTSSVRLSNKKGKAPWNSVARGIGVPAAPEIEEFSFDSETGKSSTKVIAAEDKDYNERYRTWYRIRAWVKRNGGSLTLTRNDTGTFLDGEREFFHDYAGYQSLVEGEYLLIMVEAKSQGLAGDSSTSSRRFVVAPPATVSLGTPTVTSLSDSGMVTVPIGITLSYATKRNANGQTVNDYAINPVEGVVLQCLRDVDYTDVSQIPGNAKWDDTNAQDNGTCTALTASVSELMPEVGKYTWIRVKSWRFVKESAALCRYSKYLNLTRLHKDAPTAADDECTILSADGGAGDSARVTIGYDSTSADTDDDATGTEVSWSTSKDAWTSTQPPSTFDVTWSEEIGEGEPGYGTWRHSQTLTIAGLSKDVPVYVRARRYMGGDTTTYGSYCNQVEVLPSTAPSNVVVSAPPAVIKGADIHLSWTYEGGGTQTSWAAMSGDSVLMEGTGQDGVCVIPASRYEPFLSGGRLKVRVLVSTGGDYVGSDVSTVELTDAPKVYVRVPTVTRQPLETDLYATTPTSVVRLVVSSMGASTDTPLGVRNQEFGDDVWSTVADPEWVKMTWRETTMWAQEVQPVVDQAAKLGAEVDALTITEEFRSDLGEFSYGTEDNDGVTAYYFMVYTAEKSKVIRSAVARNGGYFGTKTWNDLGDETWNRFAVPWDSYANTRWSRLGTTTWDDISGPIWGGYEKTMSFFEANSQGSPSQGGRWLKAYVSKTDYAYCDGAAGGLVITIRYLTDDTVYNEWSNVVVRRDALLAAYPPDETVYQRHVTAPPNLDLIDGASYSVSATATDTRTDLSSEEVVNAFKVDWEHKAPVPPSEIAVLPSDETDDDGIRTLSALLTLSAPEGFRRDDLYDVYRVCADGCQLVAEGVALDGVVRDMFAPFGKANLSYRIACRTSDGDVDWVDFPYTLRASHSRLDFGSTYVELPFNLVVDSGSYAKNSEQRMHLGATRPEGYWGDGYTRQVSISSDMIKSSSVDTRERLHELGRYAGPVLVRTLDGCCFEADVSPSSFAWKHNDMAMPVELQGTEISLTSEHMATVMARG